MFSLTFSLSYKHVQHEEYAGRFFFQLTLAIKYMCALAPADRCANAFVQKKCNYRLWVGLRRKWDSCVWVSVHYSICIEPEAEEKKMVLKFFTRKKPLLLTSLERAFGLQWGKKEGGSAHNKSISLRGKKRSGFFFHYQISFALSQMQLKARYWKHQYPHSLLCWHVWLLHWVRVHKARIFRNKRFSMGGHSMYPSKYITNDIYTFYIIVLWKVPVWNNFYTASIQQRWTTEC